MKPKREQVQKLAQAYSPEPAAADALYAILTIPKERYAPPSLVVRRIRSITSDLRKRDSTIYGAWLQGCLRSKDDKDYLAAEYLLKWFHKLSQGVFSKEKLEKVSARAQADCQSSINSENFQHHKGDRSLHRLYRDLAGWWSEYAGEYPVSGSQYNKCVQFICQALYLIGINKDEKQIRDNLFNLIPTAPKLEQLFDRELQYRRSLRPDYLLLKRLGR